MILLGNFKNVLLNFFKSVLGYFVIVITLFNRFLFIFMMMWCFVFSFLIFCKILVLRFLGFKMIWFFFKILK